MNTVNPALILGCVFALALPLALLIWWKKKTHAPLWEFAVGALCFIGFAVVLEPFLHQLCLMGDNAVSRAISASPLLYALYGAFAAGIFEETGRLFGFAVLLRRRREKSCAVAYGIGHGAIEVILILGLYYFTMLLAQLGVTLGEEITTASVRAAAAAIPVYIACIACFERLSAMCIHIGLSMIVFAAVRERGRLWLYPVAILLHALADIGAGFYQCGVFKSVFIVELWALALGAVCIALGVKLLYGKKERPDAEASEADE